MGRIKLCDCTLSASEAQFTNLELGYIFKGLHDANVDMIELGLACQRNYRNNPCLFYSARDLQTQVKTYKEMLLSSKKYSIVLDTAAPPEDLNEFPKDVVVRAQVWRDHYQKGIELCADMVKQGFQVIPCLMESNRCLDSEYVCFVEDVVRMRAVGFYLVDLNSMNMAKTLERIQLADKQMPSEMIIGYHGNDVTGEVLACAKEITQIPMEREVYLDCAVCGLSKTTGNLRSEIVADFLNETQNGAYEEAGFLSVYDNALKKLFREIFLANYLCAKYECSHRYMDYYYNEIGTTLGRCAEILRTIPACDRMQFTKQKAYQIYQAYWKKKLDLAVIIPTCNRATVVDHLLFQSAYQLRKYGVDIIIYDSSNDDKTENCVRNFQLEGCWNVHYHRYDGEFDGFSLDHKVISAYKDYADRYKYLWVCRDGLIITPDLCMENIIKYVQNGADCIIVDAKFRNDNKSSEVVYRGKQDCADLLRQEGARTTVLGTFIFSGELIKKIVSAIPLDEKTYGLWLPAAPLHYFAKQPFLVVRYVGDLFFYNTAGTANSFWNASGKAMEQWAYRWYTIVMNLPECYNAAKNDVLKINMFDFHPFYLTSLMRMRSNGGLSFSIVRKYEKYLPFVSDTSMWKYYAVSFMPKWTARFLSEHQGGRIFRFLRKVYLLLGKKSVG